MTPLRREVEPPRPSIGPWVPISLLGTTFVMVLAMGVAVTAERPSRVGQKMTGAVKQPAAAAAAPTTLAPPTLAPPTKLYSAADIHALKRSFDNARDDRERRERLMALVLACSHAKIYAGPQRPVAEQAAAKCNTLFEP